MKGVHDMANRRTVSCPSNGDEEQLRVPQALGAYTYGSVYASYQERDRETIAPQAG